MGKINLLSIEVANLIAAGEVVDRPASAVKELLENAIDSGASRIVLEIRRGGISFIRVADNGCGMEKEDLIPAITRHSTSKIKSAEDLDSIFTLGFRGEALAAISSVSKLRIFSRVPGAEMGAMLQTDGGESVKVIETGCQPGTTVIVEDLFFNVPARKKFLKKDSTEGIAIAAVIEKIALSHPEISFQFISDGEMKFMTSGNGNLRDTLRTLFGRDIASRSLEVDREEDGIRITGFVSEPDFVKTNRNMENFFINGRYVKSRTASSALEQAYASKIPQDRFPFCVLNIGINPSAVDVNVHPTKLEVKFSNEKSIFDAVYFAVLTALEADVTRPELNLDPDFRRKDRESFMMRDREIYAKASEFRNAFVPMDGATRPAKQTTFSTPSPEREYTVSPVTDSQHDPRDIHAGEEPEPHSHIETSDAEADPYAVYDHPIDPADIPEYIILGEAWNTYVIIQLENKLLFVDKHAAHERIIFDEMCRKLREGMKNGAAGESQVLLGGLEFSLDGMAAEALEANREKICSLGFEFITGRSGSSDLPVTVTAIPSSLDRDEASELFLSLANGLQESISTVDSAAKGYFERKLWQASCKAAVKGGRIYDIGHIKWICDRILKRPDSTGQVIRTCPHGRPVAFEIKKSSLDRQFERLV
ncbi:MAG: DNA mismatch repair endonuclease MutL [Clostridia bacterium]|nr:DNA mismatch repair endonuclease MutL [Clostridia bacterium]